MDLACTADHALMWSAVPQQMTFSQTSRTLEGTVYGVEGPFEVEMREVPEVNAS